MKVILKTLLCIVLAALLAFISGRMMLKKKSESIVDVALAIANSKNNLNSFFDLQQLQRVKDDKPFGSLIAQGDGRFIFAR